MNPAVVGGCVSRRAARTSVERPRAGTASHAATLYVCDAAVGTILCSSVIGSVSFDADTVANVPTTVALSRKITLIDWAADVTAGRRTR